MQDPDAEVEIDLSSVESPRALHSLLARELGFPHYYGANWDAFDECVRSVPVPRFVRFVGLDPLRMRLPREAELLEDCVSSFLGSAEAGGLRWRFR